VRVSVSCLPFLYEIFASITFSVGLMPRCLVGTGVSKMNSIVLNPWRFSFLGVGFESFLYYVRGDTQLRKVDVASASNIRPGIRGVSSLAGSQS